METREWVDTTSRETRDAVTRASRKQIRDARKQIQHTQS